MIVMKLNKQIKIFLLCLNFCCLFFLLAISTNSAIFFINKIVGIFFGLLTSFTLVNNYWYTIYIKSNSIEIKKLLGKNITFRFTDISIQTKTNDFNKVCIVISSSNNNNFIIYYWMTNFQQAIEFLRKNGLIKQS